jgi:hypothetical protein
VFIYLNGFLVTIHEIKEKHESGWSPAAIREQGREQPALERYATGTNKIHFGHFSMVFHLSRPNHKHF